MLQVAGPETQGICPGPQTLCGELPVARQPVGGDSWVLELRNGDNGVSVWARVIPKHCAPRCTPQGQAGLNRGDLPSVDSSPGVSKDLRGRCPLLGLAIPPPVNACEHCWIFQL